MLALGLALAAVAYSGDPAVDERVRRWKAAVDEARLCSGGKSADLRRKMLCLIEIDEVARRHLWVMDDVLLSSIQKQSLGTIIGPLLNQVDAFTTGELKNLLPKSGWFSNRIHGRQITHGAWLIAQHSPDQGFRAYALSKMSVRVKHGDVDARDYALTFDRVQVSKQLPQRFGSQFRCSNGVLTLLPIQDIAQVDTLREEIGWSQTLAETRGDNEIGKPCVN